MIFAVGVRKTLQSISAWAYCSDSQGGRTTDVQHFKLEEGTVMLEPDVQAHFPDSETVNKTLRGLITFLPKSLNREQELNPTTHTEQVNHG